MKLKEVPLFFLLAGEPSGDMHGKKLMSTLNNLYSSSECMGVGGPLMRALGLISFFPMEDLMLMGFQESIIKLPFLIKKLIYLKKKIIEKKPDACFLIDFPDFNLLLARLLRKSGYRGKIVQMISPTVWAWRKKRINILEKNFDLLLSIFPFEKNFYKESSLPVVYIGNPIREEVQSYSYDPLFRSRMNIAKDTPLISLFPGSRKSEVLLNLPKQLKILQALKEEVSPFSSALSLWDESLKTAITPLLERHGFKNIAIIPKEKRYDLMKESSLALAKSGTVTLELALNRCPSVVIYETSWINYCIAKYIVRLQMPYFSLPNLLLEEEVFKEHIKDNSSIREVAESVKTLLCNQEKRKEVLEKGQKIHNILSHDPQALHHAIQGLFS